MHFGLLSRRARILLSFTPVALMVCKKCEAVRFQPYPRRLFADEARVRQKLSKVAAPDPFTATSTSVKEGSRKIGENKLAKPKFKVHYPIFLTASVSTDYSCCQTALRAEM